MKNATELLHFENKTDEKWEKAARKCKWKNGEVFIGGFNFNLLAYKVTNNEVD